MESGGWPAILHRLQFYAFLGLLCTCGFFYLEMAVTTTEAHPRLVGAKRSEQNAGTPKALPKALPKAIRKVVGIRTSGPAVSFQLEKMT